MNKATVEGFIKANFIFQHISEIHNYIHVYTCTTMYMYMYIVYSGTHGCNTGESVYVYNVQSLFSQVYTCTCTCRREIVTQGHMY